MSKKKNFGCIHWAPQHLYIGDGSSVDYLIKFENLDSDLDKLQKDGILKKRNLKFKNKSKEDKKEKLTPKVKKLIKELYWHDFKLWNKSGILKK